MTFCTTAVWILQILHSSWKQFTSLKQCPVFLYKIECWALFCAMFSFQQLYEGLFLLIWIELSFAKKNLHILANIIDISKYPNGMVLQKIFIFTTLLWSYAFSNWKSILDVWSSLYPLKFSISYLRRVSEIISTCFNAKYFVARSKNLTRLS